MKVDFSQAYVDDSAQCNHDRLVLLIQRKNAALRSIFRMRIVLDNNNNVGMSGSLYGEDGSEREDINVTMVVQARRRINHLMRQMSNINQLIHEETERIRLLGRVVPWTDEDETEVNGNMEEPICCVVSVLPDSPAAEAGLKVGDIILQFGSLNASNFMSVLELVDMVKNFLWTPILVHIQRDNQYKWLHLTPRQWGGISTLGCIFEPMETVDR